ncbi:hypothetical protein ACWIUD_01435 [Helicobacter sp. 23-1044]
MKPIVKQYQGKKRKANLNISLAKLSQIRRNLSQIHPKILRL